MILMCYLLLIVIVFKLRDVVLIYKLYQEKDLIIIWIFLLLLYKIGIV